MVRPATRAGIMGPSCNKLYTVNKGASVFPTAQSLIGATRNGQGATGQQVVKAGGFQCEIRRVLPSRKHIRET